MKERIFGTDGVRGIANEELTPQLAFELGRAGAYSISENKKNPTIIIGKDTRVSGDMLESALVSGICSVGGKAVKIGIMPTPAIAYLTKHLKADAGVVISASHNPFEYNGIKFFNKKGYKLSDEIEDKIQRVIEENKYPKFLGKEIGTVKKEKDAVQYYSEFLKSTINTDLKGLKVAVDCANGAICKIASKTLQELSAAVYEINNKPNGENINVNCGSTYPKIIADFTVEKGADIGLSFDGDADRLIACDEKGQIIDGDHIMAICSIYFKEKGRLNNNTLVTTVMSNIGLDIALKEKGINLVKTKVGDRYVLEKIIEKGYNFGGEQSGHLIFYDYNTTGDGLLTALQLLAIAKEKREKLSSLRDVMKIYPQVLVNTKVKTKKGLEENEIIKEETEKVKEKLRGNGRILVRPSGTEPLIRVMVEGENEKEIKSMAENLASVIKEQLG